MARPRSFDPQQVLDKVIPVFWEKGFEGASIDDVVAASGVNRASLYGVFGDKQGLYLAALDRYWEARLAEFGRLLKAPNPVVPALALFFEGCIAAVERFQDRRGCLFCNAAVERAPIDAAVCAEVSSGLERLVGCLAGAIGRAQGSGEVRTSGDPGDLARAVLAGYLGMRVMAKAGVKPVALRGIAAHHIAMLTDRCDPPTAR